MPLAVHFDASATTSDETTREFHEVYYEWDFDDTGAGNHPTITGMPTRPRNRAEGPIAIHVFETAGTYDVLLKVCDGVSTHTKTITITASDWVEGATGETLCVENVFSGTGGPAGSDYLTSSDFAGAVTSNVGTYKRILFKRGDTFTSGSAAVISVAAANGGIIGAWGSGAKPIVDRTAADYGCVRFHGDVEGDWRVMDLEVDGNSHTDAYGVTVWEKHDRVLILRVDFHHLKVNIQLSPSIADSFANATIWDEWYIVDCTMTTTVGVPGGNGVYIGAQRFGLIGCVISDTTAAEHVSRWPYLYKSVLAHNDLYGPAATKLVIKMQCVAEAFPTLFPSSATEFVELSDNKYETLTAWNIVFGPQDGTNFTNEIIRNIIVERCWFVKQNAGASANQDYGAISMGPDHTYRNNIFDITGTDGVGVTASDPAGWTNHPLQDRIHCYNNTFYRASGATFTAMEFGVGSGHLARNNLGYSPGGGAMFAGSGYTASNNTGDVGSVTTDPNFVNGAPDEPAEFQITTSSYAKAAGLTLKMVTYDAFARSRYGVSYDIGFHQFNAGDSPFGTSVLLTLRPTMMM